MISLIRTHTHLNSQFVECCSIVFAVFLCDAGSSASDAIARHSSTLEGSTSLHVKLSTSEAVGETPGQPLRPIGTFETWRDGSRCRVLRRTYLRTLPIDGDLQTDDVDGSVLEYAINPTETRRMSGWDHEHPFALPLDFIRAPGDFNSVRCRFGPTDPDYVPESDHALSLLWELAPGWSLKRVSTVAKLSKVEQPDPGITRLRIDEIYDQQLVNLRWPTAAIGVEMDLSHENGWAISRLSVPHGDDYAITTAEQLLERSPGICVPSAVRTTYSGHDVVLTIVDRCDINTPIKDDDLSLEFPEGALVIEHPQGLYHHWGKGKPRNTFSTFEEMVAFEGDAIRTYQSRGRLRRDPSDHTRPRPR